jgi:glycosyltransferase involved in cell wall biosynthesis
LRALAREMATARVIALPVRENTYSGATTTLLQSMAMELPVVVSAVGAIREGYGLVNDENCCLVRPGDAESLSVTLERLLNSPERMETMGKKARQHVVFNLNWSKYVKHLTELFDAGVGAS